MNLTLMAYKDIDMFMHCALYVFYKGNKDDYY